LMLKTQFIYGILTVRTIAFYRRVLRRAPDLPANKEALKDARRRGRAGGIA
jgi:hypothetical protein